MMENSLIFFSASHVNYKAHSEEAPVAPGRGSQQSHSGRERVFRSRCPKFGGSPNTRRAIVGQQCRTTEDGEPQEWHE